MGRVLVVQRRGVSEPKEYLHPEFFLTESGVFVTQGSGSRVGAGPDRVGVGVVVWEGSVVVGVGMAMGS